MCVVLPQIIELNDFGGNYTRYDAHLHTIYLDIFRNPRLLIKGLPVFPIVDPRQHNDRHWTYAHMTSEGRIEEDRDLDLRRCERLAWVRPILDNLHNPCLKIWRQRRNSRNRVIIWGEAMDFAIILEDRYKNYALITTFMVNTNHRRQDKEKEYQKYLRDLAKGLEKPV